jgi:hypothetical protein
MSKLMMNVLAMAVVTALSVTVSAQEKPQAGSAQDKGQGGARAQKEHTMGGCLQKGDVEGTFIVRNAAEKGPRVIGIVESKANLAPHVGHHIDITGTGVANKEAESMTKVPKADHYMRVSEIKMVSATCKQ